MPVEQDEEAEAEGLENEIFLFYDPENPLRHKMLEPVPGFFMETHPETGCLRLNPAGQKTAYCVIFVNFCFIVGILYFVVRCVAF